MKNTVILSYALIAATGLCTAQTRQPQPTKIPVPSSTPSTTNPATPPTAKGDDAAKGAEEKKPDAKPTPEIKPYDQVITKEAVTMNGLFKVHTLQDKGQLKWYFEIPKSELNKDFLWSFQLRSAPLGTNLGGVVKGKVIRFERHDKKILIRLPQFTMIASSNNAIAESVANSNTLPILKAFDVVTWGIDDAAVIDVSSLYGTDGEFGPGLGSVDAARSFLDKLSAYPQNIEADVTYTYGSGGPPPADAKPAEPNPAQGPPTTVAGPAARTVGVHYSLIKLPEQPMRPRIQDDRVGFFRGLETIDYAKSSQELQRDYYIARWRLEKKDPTAAVSEPVKQIVYYIDPATPPQYVPAIKRAVAAWSVPLEAAGFKNAIVAKEIPSAKEDPIWNIEDVRNTIIWWVPSAVQNAEGPHLSDPRSGEILNANVSVYSDVVEMVRSQYFAQVSPLDPRAQKLPFPDDLMSDLVEYVVKHEVGHTLGLMHNFKASAMYPQAKMRDAKWISKMGFCASIMDYCRFDYVAQPEDHIPVKDLIPQIGPYDMFAIHWGYAPIPGTHSPADEKPTLDSWSREQDAKPYLRFAEDMSVRGSDPGEEREAIGDDNAVLSTELGLKNLARASDLLLKATTTTPGEPYVQLLEMYNRLGVTWKTEIGHVIRVVGGVYSTTKHIGQPGLASGSVPPARMKEAVAFLNEHAFQPPLFLMKPEVLGQLEASGIADHVGTAQKDFLAALLNTDRLLRMQEIAAREKDGYAATNLLSDLDAGLFKELSNPASVKINLFRRNVQRAYVEQLGSRLTTANSEVHALFRGNLIAVNMKIRRAIPRSGDEITRIHLEDLSDMIGKALDPKVAPTPIPPAGASRGFIHTFNDGPDYDIPSDSWSDRKTGLEGEDWGHDLR